MSLKSRFSVAVPLMVGALVACQPVGEDPAQEAAERAAARAAVEDAAEKWDQAFRQGDLEVIAASYTEDAVLMPPGAPTMNGRDAAAAAFKSMFDMGSTEGSSLATDQIEVGDGFAARRGHFTLSIQPEEGDAMVQTGKFIEIWSEGDDGVWRISQDIWNMDAPPPGAEGAEE